MSTSQAVVQHLPFLRRYARALTGHQSSGDAYVAATLESLISDPKSLESAPNPRVGLYRLFTKVWNSVPLNGKAEPSAPDLAPEQHLSQITPLPRQAFLLVALEGFSEEDAARILDCDLPTLRRLAGRDHPLVIAPLGHRALLAGAGLDRVVELDWWGSHAVATGIEVTLVPARHWSRRTPWGTNRRLWGGFIVKSGGRLLYFAGDSGYDERLFVEIGRRCGAPDLAMIPIGAYEPRWFMEAAHMNPAEALRVHRDVGAHRSVAMHWGTFQLTDEAREEPLRALSEAKGRDAVDFSVLSPGESLSV